MYEVSAYTRVHKANMLNRAGLLVVASLAPWVSGTTVAATLSGVVASAGLDPSPLPGARVILFDSDLTVFFEARAGWMGRYRLEAPPGNYRIGVAALDYGYQEQSVTLLMADVQLDFALDAESEPGVWETIGDTAPEEFGGSNSGSVLADGTLLFCHNTRDPVRFDPVSRTKTFPADSLDYQGCSAITLLGTGELLFVGGQRSTDFRDATNRVKSFNTWTGLWAQQPSLNYERWYPALARLADGGLLVCGGGQRPSAQRTATCELWNPASRLWTLTSSMSQPSEYSPMALLHTGEVIKTWFPQELYDPAAGTWRAAAATVQNADRAATFPDHCDHSLVLLRDGQVIVVGILPAAGSPAPVMAEHYDPCSGTWRLGGNSDAVRSRPEVAQLPDGRIFVAGGRLEENDPTVFRNAEGYVRLADLYDPTTGTWRPVAEMRVAREYHATSLLLPDGRVLTTAGTGTVGNPSGDTGVDAYSPPYLFRGPRPRIESLSKTTLAHGEAFSLDVSLAPAVTSVILIGTQATTHYVDGAVPRRLALAFTQTGGRLQATVPASPVNAPEGYYLLFVMVDDVPSEGRLVRLEPAAAPPPPDAIGGALTVGAAGDDAVLDWLHGPLNPARYNVHRSVVATDLTSPAIGTRSLVASVSAETWTDTAEGPASGQAFFYRVLGRNCDGSDALP